MLEFEESQFSKNSKSSEILRHVCRGGGEVCDAHNSIKKQLKKGRMDHQCTYLQNLSLGVLGLLLFPVCFNFFQFFLFFVLFFKV